MKSKIIKLAFLSILAVGSVTTMTSCVDETLNEDPKHPSELPSENFLANSLYQYAYYVTTPSVNYNNYNFFVQQWAETTYTDETKYNLVTRNQPRNHFNRMYVYVIGNLRNAEKSLAEETGNTEAELKNKKATLEILEILAWENIVNTFGNVPYSDAFKGGTERNFNPTYDDAKTIYTDLISRLNTVIASIDDSGTGYTSGDLVYYGNMQKWKETANAIKLRLGLNLADTDPTLAKSTIESAVTSGVYQSNSDSFSFTFDGGTFTNPVFDNLVASGRNDFVPSELQINTMITNSDPRLDKWFTTLHYTLGTVLSSELNSETKELTLSLTLEDDEDNPTLSVGDAVYKSTTLLGYISTISENKIVINNPRISTIEKDDILGYQDYYKGGIFGSLNPFGSRSHLSSYFLGSKDPANLVSYTEVSFLLAEAAQRGFSVGGSAETFYEQAIKASMDEAGVSDADATTYLAANPYNATEWKKSIGVQAWVSLFNKAYAGWNFTRRLDYPVLVNPSTSLINTVPYRMPYSDQEYVLNKTNVDAAAAAIGGDSPSTKLFWDVN
ncbi:SusD/RagB family nutrient-binding outer membrane lipoprotein [Chishuiella sp.]|uniref:SusD/RagB family nutrient-binding outer membrane lipoprotein n=1 Tax=Chishuiella sp. TaxID=1969467 RepID=UPI0028A851F9|nr:SusD/RagB family nutrient-binding outer membrane lipoprotein [Chishuiella sp.]